MKIKCLIVDDEPIAGKGILEYVDQVDFLESVGVLTDPIHAFRELNEGKADLVFLDIEMPGLNGVDLVKSLSVRPYIIFTTAYPNYALEGFELGVVDYLLKPIAFPRFLKSVNKVRELMSLQQDQHAATVQADESFFVKESGRFTRIFYNELLYAEALQNYVAFHLKGRKLISYITLSLLEKELPADKFLKVHKSYIVSLSKIDTVEGNLVHIAGREIPVSRNSRELLMKQLLQQKLIRRK